MITNVKSLNLKKGTFIELSVNHGKKKHLIPIVLKKENTNLNIGRPITIITIIFSVFFLPQTLGPICHCHYFFTVQ